jgi:predicted transcriptional regulator
MAWDVTTHDLKSPPIRPLREAWAHDLAWTQWTLHEIAEGDAWAAVGPLMEAAACPA